MSGRAKGLLFGHLETFAKRATGASSYAATIAALPPGDQEVLSGMLLAVGWYPVGTWNRVLEAYLRMHHRDPARGMDEFASYLGERELTGLVKFVLKMGSPEFMIGRTNFLWGRYFDHGTFGSEQIEPKHFRMWLDAPTNPELAPSRYNCAQGVGPWLTRGLVLAGCASGRVDHVKCRFEGGTRCEYRATW